MANTRLSMYIARLLRHRPEELHLTMDVHGWVPVAELIEKIRAAGRYPISREILEEIVRQDNKGRFRFSPQGDKIKACQGHTISWVEPELTVGQPPAVLYHGTTGEAYEKILSSGHISRMKRHGVHLQPEEAKAWQSARRWHKEPVVLKIDARQMCADGAVFAMADNGVWCTEQVPVRYILGVLREK